MVYQFLLLLLLDPLPHKALASQKVSLTYSSAASWQPILKKDVPKDTFSYFYYELEAATAQAGATMSAFQIRGTPIGLRVHYDSREDVRMYMTSSTDMAGSTLIGDVETVGTKLLRHSNADGSRYVEMFYSSATCSGGDGSTNQYGCYYVDDLGFFQSHNLIYEARRANNDTYQCSCRDCDYQAGIYVLAKFRSRYRAIGPGDDWFTTLQCAKSQLLTLPSIGTIQRVDGLAIDASASFLFRAKCVADDGCTAANAGFFKIEPIFETCNKGYYQPLTGCFPARITNAIGDFGTPGGKSVQFLGNNFGSGKPTKIQVNIDGILYSEEVTWISSSRFDVVLPRWTGRDNPVSISLILDNVTRASASFSYELLPIQEQESFLPIQGTVQDVGRLVVTGQFPNPKDGWSYKMWTTSLTGTSHNCAMSNGAGKESTRRVGTDVKFESSTQVSCEYKYESVNGGCVSNTVICVSLQKDAEIEKGIFTSFMVTNSTVQLCYESNDDRNKVTPRLRNINPNPVEEGGEASFDVTLSTMPNISSTIVTLSVKGRCRVLQNKFSFSPNNYNIAQTGRIDALNDHVVNVKQGECIIQASIDDSTRDVNILILDDDRSGVYLIHPRKTPPNYKLSFLFRSLLEGESLEYNISIQSQPIGTIQVIPDIADIEVSSKFLNVDPSHRILSFNPLNWRIPQTVKLNSERRLQYDGNVDIEVNHIVIATSPLEDPSYANYIKDTGNLTALISIDDLDTVGINIGKSLLTCEVGEKTALELLNLKSRPLSAVELGATATLFSSPSLASSGVEIKFSKGSIIRKPMNYNNLKFSTTIFSIDCLEAGEYAIHISGKSTDTNYNVNSIPPTNPIYVNVGNNVPIITASDLSFTINNASRVPSLILKWNGQVYKNTAAVRPKTVDVQACLDTLCKNVLWKAVLPYKSTDRSYIIGINDVTDASIDSSIDAPIDNSSDTTKRFFQVQKKTLYFRIGDAIFNTWSDPTKSYTSASECSEREYLNIAENANIPSLWICTACPEGGSCLGPVTYPMAKFGWWRTAHNSNKFEECALPAACLGAYNSKYENRYPILNVLSGTIEGCNQDFGYRGNCVGDSSNTISSNISTAISYDQINFELNYNNRSSCRQCSVCDVGFSRKGVYRCAKCPEPGITGLVGFFLFVGLLFFIIANIYVRFKYAHRYKVRRDGTPTDTTDSTTRRTVVTHLQCLSLVSALNVKWPSSIVGLFDFFNTVGSFDSHIANIECSRSEAALAAIAAGKVDTAADFEASHATMLYEGVVMMFFLPPLILLTMYLYWIVLAPTVKILRCNLEFRKNSTFKQKPATKGTKGTHHTRNSRVPRLSEWQMEHHSFGENQFQPSTHDLFYMSTTFMFYISHPSIARFLFRMLSCRESQGTRWLDADMLEPCDKDRWLEYVIGLIVPSIILYVVGLPLLAFFYIHKIKSERSSNNHVHYRIMQFRVGILFSGYKVDKWWWEMMVVVRKLLIILIATFGKADSLQVHYVLGFLALFAVMHVGLSPFESRSSHLLEIISLVNLCALLWVAVFFTLENQCDSDDNTIQWCQFLGFCVIASNVLFLLWASASFLKAWITKHHLDEKAVSVFEKIRSVSLGTIGRNNASNTQHKRGSKSVENPLNIIETIDTSEENVTVGLPPKNKNRRKSAAPLAMSEIELKVIPEAST
jgi:hypothetical protein